MFLDLDWILSMNFENHALCYIRTNATPLVFNYVLHDVSDFYENNYEIKDKMTNTYKTDENTDSSVPIPPIHAHTIKYVYLKNGHLL